MKTVLIIVTAAVLTLVPAVAHADDTPVNPGPYSYTDAWPAVFSCTYEDGSTESLEGSVIYHWISDPIVYDSEIGVWTYSEPVADPAWPGGISVDTQPWAEDCPYTLGVDPNQATPEEIAEDEGGGLPAPEPIADDPQPGDLILWKVGLYVPPKVI